MIFFWKFSSAYLKMLKTGGGNRRWLWLNPCVTEDSRIRVPRLMDDAFGVWIVNVFPYERRPGTEVMLGRGARLPSALKR